MDRQIVLTTYFESLLALARYEALEDGSHAGSIPVARGVIAFADSPEACERELRSTLEDWLLLGLRLRHRLPIVPHPSRATIGEKNSEIV